MLPSARVGGHVFKRYTNQAAGSALPSASFLFNSILLINSC
ncbi:hypothetical protein HMPREF1548_05396 [Clostridium sp. KLE 1755]|nr:hypothetical protein HMPREF1548_05396 [Clostridium sp. KLE 1755]